MKITVLGGGREVGRLGLFTEFERGTVLIDYGITPSNPPEYPLESPPVNNAILTHAHLDHSGMFPWLCSRYHTRVFSTPVTAEIAELLYRDSLKIADSRGHPFPYGETEIQLAMNKFAYVGEDEEMEIGELPVHFHSAGHIPGSLMAEFVDESAVCAFDINTTDTHLIRGVRPVKCDTLLVECTYAGVEHPERRELERQFLDEVDDIVKRGGKVIVPAFAVGRTQELALILHESGHEVWLDGMGHKITEIMLKYPQYLRYPEKLSRMFREVNVVYSNRGKKLALDAGIIVTTSGMMNGGPVLWYVNKIKHDPHSAVIITGYQVEGTNGRMLLENGEIDLYGLKTEVDCQVKFYDFSAHAGHSELVQFIRACSPENVVIVHSDNPEAMAEELHSANVYIPSNGDTITI